MKPTITASLPTSDLQRAFAFYKNGLGLPLTAGGETMPEPVTFSLSDSTQLMLVPRDGFSWVIGNQRVAEAGVSEVVVGLTLGSEAEVVSRLARVKSAGAKVVAEAGPQPWGYCASFRDPDGHVWMLFPG